MESTMEENKPGKEFADSPPPIMSRNISVTKANQDKQYLSPCP